MEPALILAIISIAVAVPASVTAIVAIAQTRRYQARARVVVQWDKVFGAGFHIEGGTYKTYGRARNPKGIPHIEAYVANVGMVAATGVELRVDNVRVSGGYGALESWASIKPGARKKVNVPLYRMAWSYDHPQFLDNVEREIVVPTATVSWNRDYHEKKVDRRSFLLNGVWAHYYGPPDAKYDARPRRERIAHALNQARYRAKWSLDRWTRDPKRQLRRWVKKNVPFKARRAVAKIRGRI
jgi:hypothetical protein